MDAAVNSQQQSQNESFCACYPPRTCTFLQASQLLPTDQKHALSLIGDSKLPESWRVNGVCMCPAYSLPTACVSWIKAPAEPCDATGSKAAKIINTRTNSRCLHSAIENKFPFSCSNHNWFFFLFFCLKVALSPPSSDGLHVWRILFPLLGSDSPPPHSRNHPACRTWSLLAIFSWHPLFSVSN